MQGINRTVHSYEYNNQNYLIDASREMFNGANFTFPDEPQGVIWTINGNNTSPANSNFAISHNVSAGNFWNNPLAVSAHFNAGEAYRYYRETHNRNSINGSGGNIVSLINIADEDGSSMDNAFWNGQAMFYGNGNQAFSAPLAKALDVAGHEISHGVIQNTANLEYQGESGALNESFADIFGAMIDRDDWQIGEEVVNTAIFTSGTLRDMSNPNNGGNSLGDPGWQPAHTNQQYLGSEDNGGVHINSGIPNRAYYLFATAVGKDKAERVFYRALDSYLTRSSRFLDLRAAVVQSCLDLYGQTEANAAITAFNTVGIGSGSTGGTPTDTQQDVATNPGEEFILFTDGNNNNLYLRTPAGESIANPLTTLDPISKPSITDDGSVIVFVASDATIRAITIDWQSNQTNSLTLSSNPIWRNVAISRDGNRIAALTDDNDNRLLIFDLSANPVTSEEFFLYNPTFSEGISTGNVRYADVLEWDHSGEYVMYDAYNIIPNQSGTDIDYWDIGFIQVWNNTTQDFADGNISKLFTSLPENTSVGNPTFAKNSPYVIAFDFIDSNNSSYFLMAANIETGETGQLFDNSRLNYPNYSVQDNAIIFDAASLQGSEVLGVVELNSDKITPATGAFVFIDNGFSGARWGGWFANGVRQLVDVENPSHYALDALVFPTISDGHFQLRATLPEALPLSVTVIDMLGRIMEQRTFAGMQGVNDLNFQLTTSPGMYQLRVQAGEQSKVQKVIIR
ncbi:MAG: M4 family metallopeptidase [Saprospiraceae bacterium]